MRFIERESVRYVLAGGLNTVTTHATYLVLLPLIGYAIAHSATYAARVRTRMCYRACWPSSCSPPGKRNAAKKTIRRVRSTAQHRARRSHVVSC
jgi:hypothetical protein